MSRSSRALKTYKILSIPFHALTGTVFLSGSTCRFSPTCSEYTQQAVEKYGFFKGLWLGIKRVSRCRPGVAGGFDPVV